tara:strand:- start:235 stop:1122 length:888 start_codon:yes stop_codon:yes gene_type:complete
MKKLLGKHVSQSIYEQLQPSLLMLKQNNIIPSLMVVIVGERSDSLLYVKMKKKKCAELGVECNINFLSETVTTSEICDFIKKYNENNSIYGILVQLPLPQHIDTNMVLNCVDPKKDVDGFHTLNMGNLALNQFENERFSPCTAIACMEFFDYYDIDLKGKDVVIIGASRVIGLPVSLLCLYKNATVTITHIHTKNLNEKTKNADIIISCCGVKHLVNSDYIKKDVILLDVGITKENGKIYGDINQDSVKELAQALTPVPGGVGPVTIAVLIKHVVKATLNQTNVIKLKNNNYLNN